MKLMNSNYDHPKCSFGLAEHAINLPISPFQHLLNANYITSDVHLPSIRATISEAEATLAELQHRKNLWQAVMKQMEEQEAAMSAHISTHRAILSQHALRRIPPEILGQIFLFANGEDSLFCDPNALPSPIAVSQVCRRWRRAAVLETDLWSRVVVLPTLPWKQHSFMTLFSECLTRSGRRPLSVSVQEFEHNRLETTVPIDLLKNDFPRVASIHIELLPDSFVWKILETHQHLFPSLETLEVTSSGPQTDDHIASNIFLASPLLDELRVFSNAPDLSLCLPLAQISSLTIGGSSLRTQHSILNGLTNLRELTWDYLHFMPPVFLAMSSLPDTIILSTAREFYISHNPPPAIIKMELETFRLPQLETIVGMNIQAFCDFPHFLTSTSLTSLSLEFTGVSIYPRGNSFPDYVEQLLTILPRVTPRLKSFSLSDGESGPFPGRTSSAHPLIDRGFTILIESVISRDQEHFGELEVLQLGDLSFFALSELLFCMVCERALRKLKRLELVFLEDTPKSQLSEFMERHDEAMDEMELVVVIGTDWS